MRKTFFVNSKKRFCAFFTALSILIVFVIVNVVVVAADSVSVDFKSMQENVTNVDTSEMITISFSEPIDVSSVNNDTVYVIAMETKGNANTTIVESGKKYPVNIVCIEENSFCIDVSTLASCVSYSLEIDGVIDKEGSNFDKVTYSFKTGVIANIPYNENAIIHNAAKGKTIYAGNNVSGAAGLTTWIDGNKDTKFNFNGDTYPNNYVVIDLGDEYNISSIGIQVTPQAWHSSGLGVFLKETLEGVDYSTLASNECKRLSYTENNAYTYDGMVEYVQADSSKKYRYVILKDMSNDSNKDFLFEDIYVFEEIKDEFGEWYITKIGDTLSCNIPFAPARGPKAYTMAIAVYDEDGFMTGFSEQNVNGTELCAEITLGDNDACAQAVIIDGDYYKAISPVGYWNISGYAEENGTADDFDNAITYRQDKASAVISGKSIQNSDYITVAAVKSEEQDAITAFDKEKTYHWFASAASGNGYNFKIPFKEIGNYYIRLTRYSEDKVLEEKYYSFKRVDLEALDAFIKTCMTADKADLKAAVNDALYVNEILAADSITDVEALASDNYYQLLEYTRSMLYTKEEAQNITDIQQIIDLLNAAAVINAAWNGNEKKAEEFIKNYGVLLGENFDMSIFVGENIDTPKIVSNYIDTFKQLKHSIKNGETLGEALKWSGMLYNLYGTNTEKAKAVKKYQNDLGIDLSKYDKNLSLERIVSYLKPSDMISMFGKVNFKNTFDSAVNKVKNEMLIDAKEVTRGGNGKAYKAPKEHVISGGNEAMPGEAIPESGLNTIFSDMQGFEWAKEAVNLLVENNILNGFEDGTFRPESYVTRAQFMKMLTVATKMKVVERKNMNFFDVPDESWYFPYIKIAYTNGICHGVSDNYFNPEGLITKQEMAVLLYNYMRFDSIGMFGEKKEFSDADQFSSYAKEAIEGTSSAGIINGYEDGSFGPLNNVRRAEAAIVISKLYNKKVSK